MPHFARQFDPTRFNQSVFRSVKSGPAGTRDTKGMLDSDQFDSFNGNRFTSPEKSFKFRCFASGMGTGSQRGPAFR